MRLLNYDLSSTAVSFNHHWSWDNDDEVIKVQKFPKKIWDVIIYPHPDPMMYYASKRDPSGDRSNKTL